MPAQGTSSWHRPGAPAGKGVHAFIRLMIAGAARKRFGRGMPFVILSASEESM